MEGLKVQVAPSGNLERVWLSGWLDPFSVPISASESHANEINLGAETGNGEFGSFRRVITAASKRCLDPFFYIWRASSMGSAHGAN